MGAYRGFGTDRIFAWPIAAQGTLGSKEMVDLFYSDQYKNAPNPQEARARMIEEYAKALDTPYRVTSIGTQIDDVIEPRETRQRFIRELQLLRGKKVCRIQKRHANMPM